VDGVPDPRLRNSPTLTTMEKSWFVYAWVVFAALFVLHLTWAAKRRRLTRMVSYPVMALGMLLLSFGLHGRGASVQACPIGNAFEILGFVTWSLVLLYLVIGPVFRVSLLGLFTSGLAVLLGAVALLVPGLDSAYDVSAAVRSRWVELHASMAVFSYGAFALLGVLSAMHLIQHYALHSKRTSAFYQLLSSLLHTERVAVGVLIVGVFFLSSALFVGSFDWMYLEGDIPASKWVWACGVWAGYVFLLAMRLMHRIKGVRFAWAGLVMWVLALLALIPVDHARRDHPPVDSEQTVSFKQEGDSR